MMNSPRPGADVTIRPMAAEGILPSLLRPGERCPRGPQADVAEGKRDEEVHQPSGLLLAG